MVFTSNSSLVHITSYCLWDCFLAPGFILGRHAWPVCHLSLLMNLRFSFSRSGIFFFSRTYWGHSWHGCSGWLVHLLTQVLKTNSVEAGYFDVAPSMCKNTLLPSILCTILVTVSDGVGGSIYKGHFLIIKKCWVFFFFPKAASKYLIPWGKSEHGTEKVGWRFPNIFHSYLLFLCIRTTSFFRWPQKYLVWLYGNNTWLIFIYENTVYIIMTV